MLNPSLNPARLAQAAALACALTLAASTARAENLIVNGDFSLGNTGFSTDYTYSPTSLWAAGSYAVTTDPNLQHPYAYSFGPPAGASAMLAVNGATTANQTVWSQSIALSASTTYSLAASIASWSGGNTPGAYDSSPATLYVYLGSSIIGAFGEPSQSGVWQNVTIYNISVAVDGVYKLSFVNAVTASSGNDFALTALSLRPASTAAVPGPIAGAGLLPVLALGGLNLLRRRRKLA